MKEETTLTVKVMGTGTSWVVGWSSDCICLGESQEILQSCENQMVGHPVIRILQSSALQSPLQCCSGVKMATDSFTLFLLRSGVYIPYPWAQAALWLSRILGKWCCSCFPAQALRHWKLPLAISWNTFSWSTKPACRKPQYSETPYGKGHMWPLSSAAGHSILSIT